MRGADMMRKTDSGFKISVATGAIGIPLHPWTSPLLCPVHYVLDLYG